MRKFFAVLLSIFVIFSTTVVVSADETVLETPSTDTSDVNLWTWRNFGDFFNDSEEEAIVNKWSDYFINEEWNTNNYVVNDSILVGSTFVDGEPHCLTLILTDGDFNFEVVDSNYAGTDKCMRYSASNATYVYFFNLWYNSIVDSGLQSVDFSSRTNADVYLVANHFPDSCPEDFELYNSSDVYQSFIDYLQAFQYDDMLYDVYPLKDGYKNIIRFYDCLDCYKGELGFNYYDDNMLNYLNSSVSLKTDLYYTREELSSGDNTNQFQHFENINLYIPVDDDFINSYTASEIIDLYMNEVCYAIHFRDGPISFRIWYDKYVKKYLSSSVEPKLVQLKDIAPSSDTNLTVNKTDYTKNCWFIRLQMPNQYTFIENSYGNSVMTGCRTMSTAQLLDVSTGEVNNGLNGVGSDIDGADYADNKDRDDLLADGWQNGYPNTKGDFPYKITVNKNGGILYEIYFDRKPSISSNFYTNEQIAYDVDFNLTQGYIYSKTNNCSLEFDFRTSSDDDLLSSDDTFSDTVTDSLKHSIISSYQNICSFFGYSYDSSLTTELIIRFWTNYTGSISTGYYRGYYVQFNWDLENDPNFVKNNSDDTHNYTDDYLEDEAVVDNNGNIHGGAVETSTEESTYNGFNNEDFSFDENNLWGYANSFLNFCAKAFLVLPSFVWQLIACSIVVVIILRVLGR